MSARPRYIVRAGYAAGEWLLTTSALRVNFARKLRVTSTRDTPIGRIRSMDDVGVDRAGFVVHCEEPLNPRGTPTRQRSTPLRRKNAGKVVRELTPADAEALADRDREIEQARADLATLRQERGAQVAAAWKRAVPISGMDLDDMAERPEQEVDDS